jgi:hypothetical protein
MKAQNRHYDQVVNHHREFLGNRQGRTACIFEYKLMDSTRSFAIIKKTRLVVVSEWFGTVSACSLSHLHLLEHEVMRLVIVMVWKPYIAE